MPDPQKYRIPHGVEQAFMPDPQKYRIPHGVEQAFMPAALLLKKSASAAEVKPAGLHQLGKRSKKGWPRGQPFEGA